jgi:integrase
MRGHLAVVDVMTRQGLREYPKSMKSHRTLPVPAATLEEMSRLMRGRPRDSLVFTVPDGGPLSDGYVRAEIWYPAVEAARLCGGRSAGEAAEGELVVPGQCGTFCDELAYRIRRFPPRITRHTAPSRLVQDGVPLYDVQALLEHESFATTQRYAHLQKDAHSKIRESWQRRASAEAN